jgi:tripartite-type tricarboxylate transporter receptor subunit TctC
MKLDRRFFLVLLLSVLGSVNAWADYPERPITLVVPYPAGGPSDKVARDLAEALRAPLGGATIVIENVGGAGGVLGHDKVARARNDGYTILLAHIAMATSPALYRKMPYNTLDAFEYLGLFSEVPMVLIGRQDLPADNFTELMQWIAARPGETNLAHSGLGSASHLCGLLFQQQLQVKMTTIPYKGTGPAMVDLMGGQVDLMCDQTSNATVQIEAKKVKAFAVSSKQRVASPALRDLPTLNEAGLAGFDVSVWQGLYAPKGTPQSVIDKLNTALQQAANNPEFVSRQRAMGAVIIRDARNQPAEHKKFVEAEMSKWGAVIKQAGQYAD